MNDFAFMQQDDGKKRKGVRAEKEIKFVLCGRKGDNDYGGEWLRMRLFSSTHSSNSNTQTIA